MRRTIRPLLLSLSLLAVFPVAAADLTLELKGIRAQAGHLQIALVDSDAAWNERAAPMRTQRIAAAGEALKVVFEGLDAGAYAVMVLHDENDNGKLDTNLAGIPVEGFGFSNNPAVMRKPTWDESRFDIGADDLAITIDLR